MTPPHIPPSLPLQPRNSTPFQPTMSPPTGAILAQSDVRGPTPPTMTIPGPPNPVASSSPAPRPDKPVAPIRAPFRAPIPWLSVPDHPFPARLPRRRRNNRLLQSSSISVELPVKEAERKDSIPLDKLDKKDMHNREGPSMSSEPQTPTTSVIPSDSESTQPTTPSSAVPQTAIRSQVQSQPQSKGTKPAVPLVPIVPVIPQAPKTRRPSKNDTSREFETLKYSAPVNNVTEAQKDAATEAAAESITSPPQESSKQTPLTPAPPKSWADLVRSKTHPPGAGAPSAVSAERMSLQKNEPIAEVLASLGEEVFRYSDKISFLEPRGLVNTGNMCYMNSVLQILVSCVPFYQFLDHIGRRAAHSFQSDVPMIDAMIMFMREFRVIDAASSEDQLRLRLKPNELEQYGDAFIPEFVYEVIRQLPRFRDMRRGHQQDAQEFLGFLLEEMHEECARALKASSAITLSHEPGTSEAEPTFASEPSSDGWLEVGHKQKAAVTRSSGHITLESPITKIFGGKIRSELRVPGNKNSVTLEPYQPLQLDIGSPDITNIIDALKGLTKPESIQGDFNSSRGPNVTATKQIFIESLPPVLILHLKRFQYDNVTKGTQKIWKKIGYPLDLEIPREVFPPHRRNAMALHGGLPKYRLIGVIYHHGKNAGGGHYTVDVRRQDGREWIRLDDTVIRRIRGEDVAEAGGDEDPKVLAAALDQHKRDKDANTNIYGHVDHDDMGQIDSERGWSQVNGTGTSSNASKKLGSVNGFAKAGIRNPVSRIGNQDSKVAYLLFYQRIV